jgi:hypothetical protein
MSERELSDMTGSVEGVDHPPILSHGLINTILKSLEVLCLLLAGYNGSRGSGQFTVAQSLLLPMLAVLPYRQITGARREYQWGGYERLGWDMLDVLGGVLTGGVIILVYSWVFRPHGSIGDWLHPCRAPGVPHVGAQSLSRRQAHSSRGGDRRRPGGRADPDQSAQREI